MSSTLDKLLVGGNSPSAVPPLDDIPVFLRDDGHSEGGNLQTSWITDEKPRTADPTTLFLDDSRAKVPDNLETVATSSAASLDIRCSNDNRWVLAREKILGKGNFGCATLYAVDPVQSTVQQVALSPHTKVVVKDINLQTMNNREEEMKCLEMEVSVLTTVNGHPNLLTFYDYHEASATRMAYIITEYCPGGDLGHVIEARQHLSEAHAASIAIQLLTALSQLHTVHRVVHRDVKPQNIFLLADGVSVRVGDFGIAAQLGHEGKIKAACGSPYYMAPELCHERAYDAAVDVWSLGVVMYELLALERPFNASTMAALVQIISQGQCVPLLERAEVARLYSKEFLCLVQSLLTVDVVGRPTLRRLVRNSYILKNLYTVPRTILDTKAYRQLYGEEAVSTALPKCVFEGVPVLTLHSASDDAAWNEHYADDDFEDA